MNIQMIRAAARRLAGHVRKTPLLESEALNALAGRRVLVKAECLQITGSFKARGAWSAVSDLPADGRGIIAYSSGNHAQGIAYAAREHDRSAVIVMPSDAPAAKIDNTRAFGAEVVLYDRASENREEVGDKIAADRGLVLIKPFDNEQVIAGQGTTGLEIAEQARAFGITDAQVLVCCGGGGLTAGIALALEADAPKMKVHTVEPVGFDDVKRSLAVGEIQRNDQMTGSICDAIITPQPGDLTFPILKRLCGPGFSVTDDQALQAMAAAFNHLRVVAEPGGAVALAGALVHSKDLQGDSVIVTITGGNVDAQVFAQSLAIASSALRHEN